MQEVDGVEDDPQVGGSDLIQNVSGSPSVPYDVLVDRFDGDPYAEALRVADHGTKAFHKNVQSFLGVTGSLVFIFQVGSAGLGPHHAASQKGCEPQMCPVALLNGGELFGIRIGQIQIAPQDRRVHVVSVQGLFQPGRVAGSQGFVAGGKVADLG